VSAPVWKAGDPIEWDPAGTGTTGQPARGTITGLCSVLGQPGYAWVDREDCPVPVIVCLAQARVPQPSGATPYATGSHERWGES
jgi:hypothetical protein